MVLAKDCLAIFDSKTKGELETLDVLMGASVATTHASTHSEETIQQLSGEQCAGSGQQPLDASRPHEMTHALSADHRNTSVVIEASAANACGSAATDGSALEELVDRLSCVDPSNLPTHQEGFEFLSQIKTSSWVSSGARKLLINFCKALGVAQTQQKQRKTANQLAEECLFVGANSSAVTEDSSRPSILQALGARPRKNDGNLATDERQDPLLVLKIRVQNELHHALANMPIKDLRLLHQHHESQNSNADAKNLDKKELFAAMTAAVGIVFETLVQNEKICKDTSRTVAVEHVKQILLNVEAAGKFKFAFSDWMNPPNALQAYNTEKIVENRFV